MLTDAPYTTLEYIAAIQRELGKRATTYPKIIQKRRKNLIAQGMEDDYEALREIEDMVVSQKLQYELLEDAMCYMVDPYIEKVPEGIAQAIYEELLREMAMRKKCYSLFVFRKRMTQATADEEKRIWKALCDHWKEEYCAIV